MVVEEVAEVETVSEQFPPVGGRGGRDGYAISVRSVIRGASSCLSPQVFGHVLVLLV